MMQTTLAQLSAELAPYRAQLVAVSKTYPPERLMEAYACGQRDFGENKVQEMVDKAAVLPDDVRWHFIGHLQTNKVKQIVPFVHLIHAVDSLKLLEEIHKRAEAHGRVIDVLLQCKIAAEESKFGLAPAELDQLMAGGHWVALTHVRIVGVMGMATFTDDEAQITREFATLRAVFEGMKHRYFADSPHFREISMGMSADYALALAQGSTLVRVGSLIFGQRG